MTLHSVPDASPKTPQATARRVAALVGNPNTGKTTLFNALSGLRQRVGNYPGVTVETKKGQMVCGGQPFDLIDLPGTYSLAPRSPDEMVAVDVILGNQEGEPRPDVVISIVDASNLERNLYLTTQVMELGVPVVVALNMIDVAEHQGIQIDADRLSQALGVPVIPIQANKGKHFDRLRQAIADTTKHPGHGKGPSFPEAFEKEAVALRTHLGDQTPTFLVRRLLIDVGGYTEQRMVKDDVDLLKLLTRARQRMTEAGAGVPGVEARTRYHWLRQVVSPCVTRPGEHPVTWTDRFDRILTHRIWGTVVFLALMFLVFQSIFTWAGPLMDLIDAGTEGLKGLLRYPDGILPAGPMSDLLIDGVIGGVGSVVIFLPQILILFAFIAVLEDCGYMARAAFLMDKLMSKCGLSGKSFIPLLSSVACAVPGIMAARVIEDRRDRFATIMVAPLMSCSARLPVYILLIGAFFHGYAWYVPGLVMFSMYMIGFVTAPLVALALKRTLLKGQTPLFVMEMPLYKWPSLRTVLGRMFDSGWAFLRRAGTLILASMIVIWALLYFPRTAPDSTREEFRTSLRADIEELKEKLPGAGDNAEEVQAVISRKENELARVESGGLTYDQVVLHLTEDAQFWESQGDEYEERVDAIGERIRSVEGEWKRQTLLGRLGRVIEPAVRPLGWDWKIGTAALASFPAREVVVGTLAILYNTEEEDMEDSETAGESQLAQALKSARHEDGSLLPVFTPPVALSLMVFFALCCQCVSTLAIIRRETKSWFWPLFTFAYMTVLAYLGALAVYQAGSLML
jgi:ferrous iron transport protein B